MALPPHLAKYSGLLDLLVEQLVREVQEGNQDPESRRPAGQGEPSIHRQHQPLGGGKWTVPTNGSRRNRVT
jgi:hypothetical protein